MSTLAFVIWGVAWAFNGAVLNSLFAKPQHLRVSALRETLKGWGLAVVLNLVFTGLLVFGVYVYFFFWSHRCKF